jgi:hypothetical protein
MFLKEEKLYKFDKKRVFQKSQKLVISVVIIAICLPFFIESNVWDKMSDCLFFLLGIHILLFLDYWVQCSVSIMEKYLANKPEWYQRGMAVKKKPLITKIILVIMAVLDILWFLINIIW